MRGHFHTCVRNAIFDFDKASFDLDRMISPPNLRLPNSSLRTSARGITLVELLAVVAVLTLLMGATVPALRGLGGAGKLTSAGMQVEALASAARQNAISKGTPTALIVLTSGASSMAYRVLASFELVPNADQSAYEWSQATPWQQLPEGVIIDNNTEASHFLASAPAATPGMPTVTHQGRRYEPDTGYCYQIFLPSGRLKTPPIPCNLTLASGFIENGAMHRTDSGANYFSLHFADSTGESKVVRP